MGRLLGNQEGPLPGRQLAVFQLMVMEETMAVLEKVSASFSGPVLGLTSPVKGDSPGMWEHQVLGQPGVYGSSRPAWWI